MWFYRHIAVVPVRGTETTVDGYRLCAGERRSVGGDDDE